jgi:hypothetical protein
MMSRVFVVGDEPAIAFTLAQWLLTVDDALLILQVGHFTL